MRRVLPSSKVPGRCLLRNTTLSHHATEAVQTAEEVLGEHQDSNQEKYGPRKERESETEHQPSPQSPGTGEGEITNTLSRQLCLLQSPSEEEPKYQPDAAAQDLLSKIENCAMRKFIHFPV